MLRLTFHKPRNWFSSAPLHIRFRMIADDVREIAHGDVDKLQAHVLVDPAIDGDIAAI